VQKRVAYKNCNQTNVLLTPFISICQQEWMQQARFFPSMPLERAFVSLSRLSILSVVTDFPN
jgi:hypothetical protein